MRKQLAITLLILLLPVSNVWADRFQDTIEVFRNAGASGGRSDATTVGGFNRGLAIFTVARGGLMYEASIGGARFNFTPL